MNLLILGTFLFVKHLSFGSGNSALAINESEWVESGHYEGKVLSTGSIDFLHLISLRVWGIAPDLVLRVLRPPGLEDLYGEQDARGITPFSQMTRKRIIRQIKRLKVVASGRFALGIWIGISEVF